MAENSVAELQELAKQLQREQRLDDAIAAWKAAIRQAPAESSLRLNLARLFSRAGQPEHALATYLALVDAAPTMQNVLVAAQDLDELVPMLPYAPSGRVVRIALVGNATLDHLQSYLKVECYRAGLRPEIYQGGFDQYNQEILDPASGLYAFAPEVLICAIHPSRLFPTLREDPSRISIDERRAEMDAGLDSIQQLLDAFTQRSSAVVLLHNMIVPQHPPLGILDARDELGQVAAFTQINLRLADLVRTRYTDAYMLDEDRVQSHVGKREATDPRMWYAARMPWSADVLSALAGEYLRYIRPLKGVSRKCIVVDLDNTLWGGVIGEDGAAAIQLGSDAPGNVFVAFQQELEKLWRRGILLAICSKNNPDDVMEMLDRHPDMILRASHFAARRINWSPKANNIREIAAELNIGLDSLVFLDDNPVERAEVRAVLPEVLVPELPVDAAGYRACLLQLGVFDSLAITTEDRQRNQLYADQKARREAAGRLVASASIEDYLADLALVVEVCLADDLSLPRIAQLTNKTNQLNLTTHRYSESDIRERIARGWRIFGARVRDRFGDNGLTGVIMAEPTSSDVWSVDTLLLSCRVMGRRIETALLELVGEQALAAGATRLQGWFLPTEKNAPAEGVYRENGFRLAEQRPDGGMLWELDLAAGVPRVPAWLAIRTPPAA